MKNTQKTEELKQDNLEINTDTSNTQDKQELKYEKHEIKGTPFTIVEEPINNEKSQYHVTVGRYRLNTYEKMEEAVKECNTITWDKIIQVIGILIEANKEINEK